MHTGMRSALAAVAAVGLVAAGTTAAAHEDHGGTWEPSPVSQSANLKIVGSVPRTSEVPSYRNSDLAFWGQTAFAGNYDGFRVIDVSDPAAPTVVADVDCPGSQHDVSVWKGLMFLSIDAPLTAPECGSPRAAAGTPGFEGIRIFDVRDRANPRYVGAVATDCGSHTNTWSRRGRPRARARLRRVLPERRAGRVLLRQLVRAAVTGTARSRSSRSRANPARPPSSASRPSR